MAGLDKGCPSSGKMPCRSFLNHRTGSRMIDASSVHYEHFTNWSPAGFGRRDQRTRKRSFSAGFVAAERLASASRKPPPEMDQRLAVVESQLAATLVSCAPSLSPKLSVQAVHLTRVRYGSPSRPFVASLTLSILMSTTALGIFWPVWLFGTLLVCPMLLCWPLSLRARCVTWSVFFGSAGAGILWLLLEVVRRSLP
jgi:hypothetical protein